MVADDAMARAVVGGLVGYGTRCRVCTRCLPPRLESVGFLPRAQCGRKKL